MNYSITLVWSFRNRLEIFKKSLQSAHKFCPSFINFCLVDAASEEQTIRDLRTFCNGLDGRKIRICESAYRTTVSEAWNLGIMLSETRYVIFVSSDVEFLDNTWLKNLQKMIAAGYEYVLVENHAVFMIDKKALPQIGWFDERFALGPHFDTDYMIRASEEKIRFIILPNNKSYLHGDTPDITKARKKGEIKDRLPFHDVTNEVLFKQKWKTTWPGWESMIHPPTHIRQVERLSEELDPHPFYTKKYKLLYSKESFTRTITSGAKRISVKISERLLK